MAKKKAVKKSLPARTTSVALRFISDPGHGWVEVPGALLKKLRLGDEFTRRGDFFYLEADEEATRLDRAMKRHNVEAFYADHEVDNFDEWLGGTLWPYIPAMVYGDDIDLLVYAIDTLATQMKQSAADPSSTPEERAMFSQQWDDLGRLSLMFSTMKGGK
jgi:hypothetical protein